MEENILESWDIQEDNNKIDTQEGKNMRMWTGFVWLKIAGSFEQGTKPCSSVIFQYRKYLDQMRYNQLFKNYSVPYS